MTARVCSLLTRRALQAWLPATAFVSFAGRAAAEPAPARVVSLDWALAETMLELGATPLAVVAASDWPRFVVAPSLPRSVADLGLQQELNFELLAQLRPDLILISPFLEHLSPQIRRIAPCKSLSVYQDNRAPLALREAVTRSLGRLLGREASAESYIAAAHAELDELRARAARLAGRPLLLASFVDGRHVRVYGGASLFQNVLARLGLTNAWGETVNAYGFELIGIERLVTAEDVQLIAIEPIPPDVAPQLAQSPLWTRLPFIAAGHFATIPPVLMFGGMPAALRFARLLVAKLETA